MVSAVIARARMPDSARNVLSRVTAEASRNAAIAPNSLAEAYVRLLLDDVSGSLRSLGAVLQRAPQMRSEVATLPWFNSLHANTAFLALVSVPTRERAASAR